MACIVLEYFIAEVDAMPLSNLKSDDATDLLHIPQQLWNYKSVCLVH